MNIDQARDLLRAIILDANDIRDRYRDETYRDLLRRAFALVGLPSGDFSEEKSRVIVERAHRAAANRGLYASPIDPAEAALSVLRAASRTGR